MDNRKPKVIKKDDRRHEDNKRSSLIRALYALIDEFPEKAEEYLMRKKSAPETAKLW
jgi:hypothetical protein